MSDCLEIVRGESRGSATAVELKGPIDARGAQHFKKRSLELQVEGCKCLIVDLGGVDFICSSGVGALLVVGESYEESGGNVQFVNLSHEVKSVLSVLYLMEELTVRGSVDEAFMALPKYQQY